VLGHTDKKPNPTGPKVAQQGVQSKDRATRRATARMLEPENRSRPFARLGTRAKPVKDPVWQSMQSALAATKILKGIRIWKLVEECPEMRLVEQYGSVYALSRLSTESIRLVPGLGPVKRKKIREYLLSKNVPVKWEA